MRITKSFLLFVFIIASTLATGQCLVSTLVINTGYDPITGLAIPGGASGATPVTDPHWIVTAESPSVAVALTATTYTEVTPGSSADIITTLGGWVSNPAADPGGWISCFNGQGYTSDGTGPTGTAYNMTLGRPFRLCTADSITFDLYIANDNYISSIDVDGILFTFSQPPLPVTANFTMFTHFTETFFLAAGTHTMHVVVNNYNDVTPLYNPTGLDIYGTVSSSAGINSLVSESYASCATYVCTSVCDAISLPDTLHPDCGGATIVLPAVLTGPDSILNISWSPATGLSDDSILNPTLTTGTTSSMYHISVQALLPFNLVANGDFSAGNIDFTTSYLLEGPATTSTPGYYAVNTNPNVYDAAWPIMGDHTTGTGNMLMVDGSPTPGVSFWCETVPVLPFTNYVFSVWSALLHTPLPSIQITINGVIVSAFSTGATAGVWGLYQVTWNSGTNTTASICMTDLITTAFGNDFAIDDISFRQICTAEDSVYMALKIPDTLHSNTNTSACMGSGPITLTAPVGYTSYLWNTGSSATSIAVTETGIYSIFAMGNCTAEADTTQVTFYPVPIVRLGNDTTICTGDKITLGSTEPAGLSYLWNTGSVDSSITIANSGTYSLVVTNNGCSASASIQVNEIPKPTPINLGPDTTLCKGEEIRLYANGDTVLWSDGSRGQSLLVIDSGIYWASVNTQCGIVSDSINVDIGICDIWFPSAFTPNGDGRNDIIRVVGNLKYYTDFSLSIYDRFGQRVFYTEDIYSGWNGLYNGVKQDLGTYFYFIYYTLQGNKHMMKGDFQLIR